MGVARYRPKNLPPAETYKVGYGNPPIQSRFQPGQSGNPSGRPKGSRNINTVVREALLEQVTITHNGRTKKVAAQDALILRYLGFAMSGKAAFGKIMADLWRHASKDDGVSDSPDLSADEKAEFDTLVKRIRSGAVSTEPVDIFVPDQTERDEP